MRNCFQVLLSFNLRRYTKSTSLFNLGYGTNHPKYEAARAKNQGSYQRALEGAGGRSFVAEATKQLGLVTGRGLHSPTFRLNLSRF
jgi:hypothetical protein